jgi:hypothetical protein
MTHSENAGVYEIKLQNNPDSGSDQPLKIMLNLNYSVMKNCVDENACYELSSEESLRLSGGFWETVTIGLAGRMIWEAIQHPEDVYEGFIDALS